MSNVKTDYVDYALKPVGSGNPVSLRKFETYNATTGALASTIYVKDVTDYATVGSNMLASDLNAIGNAVNSNSANFASEYSPSATYAVGAYCTYQNVLYKCTAAITTPEAWNSAHWAAAPSMTELIAPLVYPNAGSHNGVFRGKDISASVNDGSFYQNIENGSFKDIYIGDYFTKIVNGTAFVFRVAGLDVYLHRGDTEFTSHHVVIVPDSTFGKYQMNDTDTTAGGYVGSKMYTSVLPLWAGYLTTAFGTNLLTNRELLTNAISGEDPSDWTWYDSKVNMMSEEEVTGCHGYGQIGLNTGSNIGIAYGQLPLFRLAPEFICNRNSYWLKNIVSSNSFASINNSGDLSYYYASYSWYLRPRFLLG